MELFRPRQVRGRRLGSLLGLTGLFALAAAAPAFAHTEFDRSTPADGERVKGPLERIEIVFTNAASEAGEGFVVLDPGRGEIAPDRVRKPDRGRFLLEFDRPLSPGDIGVRWTVRAPDTHPINGSFSFTLRPGRDDGDGDSEAPVTVPTGGGGTELEGFLAEKPNTRPGEILGRAGRAVTFAGLAAAIGLAIFGLAVLRGSPGEARALLGWVRLGGVLIVLGTLLDAAGQVIVDGGGPAALTDPSAWRATWDQSLGIAWLIRIAGGGLVAYGTRGEIVDAAEHHLDPIRTVTERIPAASAAPSAITAPPAERWQVRLRVDRSTAPIAAGVGLLLLTAHSFDGHTVNEGNRLLTSAAAAIHVLAGSIWAAGIVALAWIVRGRVRRREPSGALMLLARFSVVAGLALALVAVVGVYLTVVILDSPAQLWSTDWGKVLIAKVLVVGLAAGIGGYNHFKLIPRVEAGGDRGGAGVARLGVSLRAEAAVMLAVLALTAVLVRASSVG